LNSKLISIIIPVYNEEKQIPITIQTIDRIINENTIQYEMILIDDGSSDPSWKKIKELSTQYPFITGLKLSKNFGKESAICAGLEKATGDAAVIIDADLQHPPEIIPQMVQAWLDEGYDVIEGVKSHRGKERIITRIGSKIFYHLLNKAAGFNLNSASDFKLLDKKVVNAWKRMPERNMFFRGMSEWLGYKRKKIPIIIADREIGKSKWSLSSLIRLAVTAISSFSAIPLHLVSFLGSLFFIGAIILGIHSLYMKFSGFAVSGFTTVILLQLIIGSTLMISLGIIGIYIAKIFDEVKSRPRYLISETINKKEKSKSHSKNS
jgi:polyisoprenyl-phosphate glycosyltransferase